MWLYKTIWFSNLNIEYNYISLNSVTNSIVARDAQSSCYHCTCMWVSRNCAQHSYRFLCRESGYQIKVLLLYRWVYTDYNDYNQCLVSYYLISENGRYTDGTKQTDITLLFNFIEICKEYGGYEGNLNYLIQCHKCPVWLSIQCGMSIQSWGRGGHCTREHVNRIYGTMG